MSEISTVKKHKIVLSDYPFEQDVYNRTIIANFSPFDFQVLGEILFSPLKISLKKLCRSLQCQESDIGALLDLLSKGGLLTVEKDNILVDKEIRKYFELQVSRFDEDFKPDMDFIQGLLKKVPIHCLPSWYAIPRSSNNIFESIVEKYLLSPQIFQRHLQELQFNNPVILSIVRDLFQAPDFKISSTDVIAKYNLTRHDFEEILILLEFHFICCVTYEREDDHWTEFVTPFHEWHEYLRFLKRTEAPPIDTRKSSIVRRHKKDFGFIEDISFILESSQKKKNSLAVSNWPSFEESYFHRLIDKICLIKLGEKRGAFLSCLDSGKEWLDMGMEERALFLYRHPLNRLTYPPLPASIATERNIREAEKAIKRLLQTGWVFFDDFFKGVLVPFHEDSVISLKKSGKQWRYTLPTYNELDKMIVKATMLEWLFETGMTVPGTCEGKDCLTISPFGKFFFDD